MSQNIIFMGTPEFSIPTLKTLIRSEHKIISVYSQPAKKSNRGMKINSSSVEIFAKDNSLNLRCPISLNNEEEYNFFKKLNPDLVIVVAYGKIIPEKYLKIPKNGFINLHASLLPKWRGAAPIQRSIMNQDDQTGISIMKIVEKLDSGPVMHQDKININEGVDTLTLSKILSEIGAKSILTSIDSIEKRKAIFIEQDHSQATYAKKISKAESQINWKDNAKTILAKINGLNPNPGAWFKYKNERYKIWKAEIKKKKDQVGLVVDNNLTISCNDHSIRILEIQKEGKSRQSSNKFLLGNKIKQGEKFI